jgi:hypothetical protein
MDNLPPELRDRRDSIFDRVTTTGRTRRRRRTAAAFAVVAVVLAIPITAVAMNASHESPGVRVSSVPSTSVTPTVADPTGTTETTTTVKAGCHNSYDPACGPLRYAPPLTNEPARLEITSVTPAVPKVGEMVTFTLRARDPDSLFSASTVWCNGGGRAGSTFGDGEGGGQVCIADCVGAGSGTWDPPAPQPSDLTFHSDHVYKRAGTFAVKITAEAGVCSARPSEATASTTVTVVAG